MWKSLRRHVAWTLAVAAVGICAMLAMRRTGNVLWTAEIRFVCTNSHAATNAFDDVVDVNQESVPRIVAVEQVERCFSSPSLRDEVFCRVLETQKTHVHAEGVRNAVDQARLNMCDGHAPTFAVSVTSSDKELAVCVVEVYFNSMVGLDSVLLNERDNNARRQLMSCVEKLRNDITKINARINEQEKAGQHSSENLVLRRESANEALLKLESNLRLLSDQKEQSTRIRQIGNLMVTKDEDK